MDFKKFQSQVHLRYINRVPFEKNTRRKEKIFMELILFLKHERKILFSFRYRNSISFCLDPISKEANPINYILNKEYSNTLVSLDSIS